MDVSKAWDEINRRVRHAWRVAAYLQASVMIQYYKRVEVERPEEALKIRRPNAIYVLRREIEAPCGRLAVHLPVGYYVKERVNEAEYEMLVVGRGCRRAESGLRCRALVITPMAEPSFRGFLIAVRRPVRYGRYLCWHARRYRTPTLIVDDPEYPDPHMSRIHLVAPAEVLQYDVAPGVYQVTVKALRVVRDSGFSINAYTASFFMLADGMTVFYPLTAFPAEGVIKADFKKDVVKFELGLRSWGIICPHGCDEEQIKREIEWAKRLGLPPPKVYRPKPPPKPEKPPEDTFPPFF